MLRITVTGDGIASSEDLRSFIEGKFSRMERYAPRINKLQVILRPEPRGGRSAEAICRLAGGKSVVVHAAHSDLYAAVDLLADKLRRQLAKVHARRSEHRGRRAPWRSGQAAADVSPDEDAE